MVRSAKDIGVSRLGTENVYNFVATSALYVVKMGLDLTDTAAIKYLPDNIDIVFCDPTTHAISIYLPPVSQYAGRTVYVGNLGAANVVVYPFAETTGADSTILDGSGSQVSQTLTNAKAFTKLWSNGISWVADAFDLTI
jgi:hypothetical protein